MSGLRFETADQMPPGMRNLYKAQVDAEEEKKRNKYGAIKEDIGNIRFDSKAEARRFRELYPLWKSGEIQKLKLQPQFTLQESYMSPDGQRVRAIRYTADFSYIRDGKLVVEDVKSAITRKKAEFQRNKKLMREKYEIEVIEVIT